jgi:vacuolar-type H+-ATPase subunit E/Vma4
MPESLENFVKKLQSEGVEAGKNAAEEIKKEAMHEAEKILAGANAVAKKIMAKATSDAERRLCRAKNELALAVRDAILKLGESLGEVLTAILDDRAEKKLSEPDYIGEIMREVIIAYAQADAGQSHRIEINISKAMHDKLNNGALDDLFRRLQGSHEKLPVAFNFSKAGFEYTIDGATVEISPDSVSDFLAEMVSEDLQEIIDKVVGKKWHHDTA